MSTTVRVPQRVVDYMDGTGWGQRVEAVTDEPRRRLLAAMERPTRRGITLHQVDRPMLARLYFEAEHLADSWRYGDHDDDTYADYRAATRLQARIVELDPTMRYYRAVEILDVTDR